MDRRNRTVWCLITLTLFNGIVPPNLFAEGWSFGTTTIEEVARRIDNLQKQIDDHGVIVAKKPDVWGESRLLRHREEFEAQMKLELTRFRSTLQAKESTRDVAFLASALAVSNNVAAPTTADPNNTSQNSQTINVDVASLLPGNDDLNSATSRIVPRSDKFGTNIETKFTGPDADGKYGEISGISLEPVTFLNQKKRYLEHLNALRRLNEGDDVGDSPGYALNLLRIPVSVLPGRETRKGYGAEISITVDPYESGELLPEVFRNFVVNGVVDRISPSVMQAIAVMDETNYEKIQLYWYLYQYSILFQEFIHTKGINDLASDLRSKQSAQQTLLYVRRLKELEKDDSDHLYQLCLLEAAVNRLFSGRIPKSRVLDCSKPGEANAALQEIINRYHEESDENQQARDASAVEHINLSHANTLVGLSEDDAKEILETVTIQISQFASSVVSNYRFQIFESLPTDSSTTLKQAFSVTKNPDVNGMSLIPIYLSAYEILKTNNSTPNFEDVRRFLKQEVADAYDMLSQPLVEHGEILLKTGSNPPKIPRHQTEIMEFWRIHCSQDLVNAVNSHRRRGEDLVLSRAMSGRRKLLFKDSFDRGGLIEQKTLSEHRKDYYVALKQLFPELDFSISGQLGWQILVESAMLNDRLKQDMREIKVEKGCPCLNHEGLDFYGPRPSLEARQAFNEYVRCRWPVKVFALDPVTDEQNVGAGFSQRRELQMALAIGFSQGLFGAQNLDRYVRRLEYDLETIELNRTSVGYAFGEDTFGWRFYPRVQTPSVPGNFETKFRDLLIGGRSREHALKDRMLEAGMRECTALVVMPSFIPYMNIDIQTNYFKIGKGLFHKPFRRKNDLSDAVTLSRELTEVRNLVYQCVEDQHLYRPEEIAHLQRAINRIDHQLPLQCEVVQVPYENTLSGFEAFNSGISDLGPQLLDWYGAPGILVATGNELPPKSNLDVTTKDTTNSKLEIDTIEKRVIPDHNPLGPTQVFLIGKNFTSLGEGTRVIAGGMDVTDSKKVVNRDIISVLIPSSVMTSEVRIDKDDDPKLFVDVHLATPHGVTSRIRVPAIEPRTAKKTNVQLAAVTKKLDEIEKTVKAVDARQITKVTWADKKNEGSLKTYLDANGIPQYLTNVEKNSELKVPVCAFSKDIEKIDVAFQVEISTDEKEFNFLTDTNKKALYIPFPNSVTVKPDSKGVPTAGINYTQLEWLIEKVLHLSNYRKDDIKAIRIHGCVRLRNKDSMVAEWPVYKIDDYLEIKLASIDACVACKNVNCTCKKTVDNLPPSSIWSRQAEPEFNQPVLISDDLQVAPQKNERFALPLLPGVRK